MSVDRISRINQLLKQEIAESMYKVMHDPDVDMSAITITRVITSRDLQHARVFVSITGDVETQEALMNRIKEHRKEFQQIINRNMTMRYTPRLIFTLDESIKEGDRVLDILANLENGSTDTSDELRHEPNEQ